MWLYVAIMTLDLTTHCNYKVGHHDRKDLYDGLGWVDTLRL